MSSETAIYWVRVVRYFDQVTQWAFLCLLILLTFGFLSCVSSCSSDLEYQKIIWFFKRALIVFLILGILMIFIPSPDTLSRMSGIPIEVIVEKKQ